MLSPHDKQIINEYIGNTKYAIMRQCDGIWTTISCIAEIKIKNAKSFLIWLNENIRCMYFDLPRIHFIPKRHIINCTCLLTKNCDVCINTIITHRKGLSIDDIIYSINVYTSQGYCSDVPFKVIKID